MSDCSRLITLAKVVEPDGGGSDVECVAECDCDGARLLTVRQRVAKRVRGGWCDELAPDMPDGSHFEAEIRHHLRLPSACGAWIGLVM